MEPTIRKLALANALKFRGTANPKALIGALIKEVPSAKDNMEETLKLINSVVEEVNSLDLDEQKEQLVSLEPDFFDKLEQKKKARKEEHQKLPPLPNAEVGKVVTRMPPEPSKYPHLGHAMSFLINYLYAKMYEGRVILRLDDTNPEKESQEFVDAIKEDVIDYLKAEPDETVFASDHMDKFYEFAERLINENHAYTCTCTQEEIRDNRRNSRPCPHRNNDSKTNLSEWEKMKKGEEGIVLRLKIDMEHKNAVMRDPVIYRVSNHEHYKTGNKYKAWPMYDFESTIEEGLCGVTHVLRGNEFDQRIELQDYIGGLFGFPKVTYKHYGRFSVQGATTQGREIRALIESGEYMGWDDPRLVTLRALKRRGILRESFYELAQRIGMSKTQTTLDFSVIAAVNRSILDKQAKRFFAIEDPILIEVSNIPSSLREIKLAYHPEEDKGKRTLRINDKFYMERKDYENIKKGQVIRFMDAFNLEKINDNHYGFVSSSYEEFQKSPEKGPIIHFLPVGEETKISVLMDNAEKKEMIAEKNISVLKEGDVIQFERWGFCRLDDKAGYGFWFTHS